MLVSTLFLPFWRTSLTLALFVPDDDPLLFYRAIARLDKGILVEGGHLCFEINALCGKETVAMLRQENYTEVELIQDLYGKTGS